MIITGILIMSTNKMFIHLVRWIFCFFFSRTDWTWAGSGAKLFIAFFDGCRSLIISTNMLPYLNMNI